MVNALLNRTKILIFDWIFKFLTLKMCFISHGHYGLLGSINAMIRNLDTFTHVLRLCCLRGVSLFSNTNHTNITNARIATLAWACRMRTARGCTMTPTRYESVGCDEENFSSPEECASAPLALALQRS